MSHRVVEAAALAAAALALPFLLDAAWLTTVVFVLIAAIAVTGLNVLTGYAGQVSLGHAFFLAAGAYGGVLLADAGLPAFVWLLGAGVIAAVFGAVVGPVALRLSGLYLAIVTLGLVFLGQHILFNVNGLSGGPEGRTFPSFSVGGLDFATDTLALGPFLIEGNGLYYYLVAALLLVATWYARNLRYSRAGRAMAGVRQRELAAEVMGVDVARTKVAAFVASSFLAGVSGALYAAYVGFAQPGHWDVMLSIQYVAAVVIGGMGSVAGPFLGALVVFALPSVLQELPFLDEGGGGPSASDVATIAYGVLVVLFLVAEPRGLVGLAQRVGSVTRRWRPTAVVLRAPKEEHP